MIKKKFVGRNRYSIPYGAIVEVIKNFPRRRVVIRYEGKPVLTFQGCLRKI